MAVARRDGDWIRCAQCGHKLGRMVGIWESRNAFPAIEIKCHGCREMNYIMVGGGKKNERVKQTGSVSERA